MALLAATPSDRSSAIINGSPDDSAPSWVAILAALPGDGDGTGLCSGALIAANLVISAKHCGDPTPNSATSVGQSQPMSAAARGSGGPLTERFVHPTLDLAIYKLERPLPTTPVKIGSVDPTREPGSQIPLTLYGYGSVSELPRPSWDYKLRTAVGLVSACNDSRSAPWFCLKPQSIQVPCIGDSGGALVASGMLVGVYGGTVTDPRKPLRCIGNNWVAVSVTDPDVRAWINGIIISNPPITGSDELK